MVMKSRRSILKHISGIGIFSTSGCMALPTQRPDIVLVNRDTQIHNFMISVINSSSKETVLQDHMKLGDYEKEKYNSVTDLNVRYDIIVKTKSGRSSKYSWTQSNKDHTLNIALTEKGKFAFYTSKP